MGSYSLAATDLCLVRGSIVSNAKKNNDRKLKQWEVVSVLFALFDACAIAFSYFISLWLRFDCSYSSIPSEDLECFCYAIGPHIIITVAIFSFLHLYNSVWKYAGYYEFVRITIASLVTFITNLIVTQSIYDVVVSNSRSRMPISYFILGGLLQFTFAIGIRFSYRTIQLIRKRNYSDIDYVKPVLIYGAGDAGRMIAKDIANTRQIGERVVAFIDDNPEVQRRLIDGIKVVGGRDDILKTVEDLHIKKIYVAMPSIPKNELKEILNICTEASCEVLSLPSMYQLYTGNIKVSQMKEVAIEDLLGRDSIQVNDEEIGRFIEGKTVLITGAGGRWCNNRTNQEKSLFYRRSESFGFAIN